MIKNYFKTAWRNFQRHQGYTFISVAGLAVGLATTIFILLWVNDELRFDSFHKNRDTLYKVWQNSAYGNGSVETYPATSSPLPIAAKAEIPEIEYAVRVDWGSELLFTYNEISLMEKGIWADPDLFKMFTFPITLGDRANPVPDNASIAISEKIASKYFPNEDPIGKMFKISEQLDMKVTAVFQDVPTFSSLQFDFVLPFETYQKRRPYMAGNWNVSSNQTFVKLYDGASADDVNKKMISLVKKHCKDCSISPFLQLYKDFHLYSNFKNGKQDGGAIEYVRSISIVAIFILILACINFMNMATARSSTRCREVGVRKVIGAQRKSLVLQFLGESLMITSMSMVLALAVVQLALPFFNSLTNKQINFNFYDQNIILALFGIVLVTGILAGSYPAFFLSSFKPVSVLKGNVESVKGEAFIRKGLVVFQFSLSIILISGSIIVYNQIQFIRTKNLGLNRENILTLDLRGSVQKNIESFKTEALRHPGIISLGAVSDYPFDILNTTSDPVWPGKKKDEDVPFKVLISDDGLIPMLDITILEGRNFSADSKGDTSNYIVNEAAVKAMGLKDPVGTPLEMWFGKGKIIGVVKDFHNQNFRSAIDPLIMTYYPSNTWRLFVKLDGKNLKESIQNLEKVYKKFDPVYPFSYSFLDHQFNSQYQREITTGKLATCFTSIAIFISCLGLFGLASFTAERRTKELGVRKVLGASISNLVTLLCGDFAKLILMALIVGIPIAYYMTYSFLTQYTFHTDLSLWIFVVTAFSILLIAMITVIFQSIKAALTNPVNSLRAE